MFRNLGISHRLLILISVLTLTFLSTGAVTLISMNEMMRDTALLDAKTSEAAALSRLASSVRYHMLDVGQRLYAGAMSWEEADQLLQSGAQEFDRLWQRQLGSIAHAPQHVEFFKDSFGIEVDLVRQGYAGFAELVAQRDLDRVLLFVITDLRSHADPFLNAADALSALGSVEAQAIFEKSQQRSQLYLWIAAVVVLIGFLAASILGPWIYLSITSPIRTIANVITRVAQGDPDARTGLETQDELGQLGSALDNMLEQRVSSMATDSSENESLNNSVIMLLEPVSDLGNRDLTVNAPVAGDMTGPVADAMNLMAIETARVLNQIRSISNRVAEAASCVENQGNKINRLADDERRIIEDTMAKLDEACKTMNLIAMHARNSIDLATRATASTEEALETVTRTEQDMSEIREILAETERRVERIGGHAQKIDGVVEIINGIAERTHSLVLDASMQAAAAGDVGRDFAVVTNELQRLAESSRDSTPEIADLASDIRAETTETMAAMNKATSLVVEGSELAQDSAVKLQAARESNTRLVESLEQVARRSLTQAQVSNLMREQTQRAQRSTRETNAELRLQADQTNDLVAFSRQLLDSVNVFKLPEAS